MTLFIIDAPNIIYRAFHAIPGLRNSRGFPTNAIFGFANMLLRVFREWKPDAVVAAFDAPAKTFRDAMFAGYKADRKAMPDDMRPQLPYIDKLLDAFRIHRIQIPGYEADDIIASLARRARAEGWLVVIVSGDKDLMQLVDDGVKLLDTMKDKLYDRNAVMEKWGVPPEKLGDVLALMGDAIDNVPGVPGIGEKTAAKLIGEFGSLENLLASTARLKGKQRENLERHQEDARLSRKLVALRDDCEIPYRIEDFKRQPPDCDALKALFRELEFRRLEAEFSSVASADDAPASSAADLIPSVSILVEPAQIEAAAANVQPGQTWAVSVVCDDDDGQLERPIGVALACRDGARWYFVPLRGEGAMRSENGLLALRHWLGRNDLRWVSDDAKRVWLAFFVAAQAGPPCDDIPLMSYVLNPSRPTHALESLAEQFFGYPLPTWESVCGKGREARPLAECRSDELALVAAKRAHALLSLLSELEACLIREKLIELYLRIERPLIPVLAAMEYTGVKVDRERLAGLSRELGAAMAKIEAEIYALAGGAFNINSPRQLGEVLFQKLGYTTKGVRKTKTGQYSTDGDVLEKLAATYPLPRLILQYRTIAKLKGTYVDALPPLVGSDGRIHTRFNQIVAATGRLSSSNPNLQNIPIRDDEGRKIRAAFIAEAGYRLLSFDYNQIELRLLAHIADDPILQESFRAGEDVHRRTAAEIFGVEPAQVDAAMRRKAKAVNFGIAYGQTGYGLAQALGITPIEAQAIIDRYFQRYPGVKRYLETMPELARKQGYVTTLFGRRRMLPDIHHPNLQIRQFAERMAINTPIQGTAADLIKMAMIRVYAALRERKLATRMILQVHDELLFEAPEAECAVVRSLVGEIMENVIALKVPLTVDVGEGRNWSEAHG